MPNVSVELIEAAIFRLENNCRDIYRKETADALRDVLIKSRSVGRRKSEQGESNDGQK